MTLMMLCGKLCDGNDFFVFPNNVKQMWYAHDVC
jgi:hypothetical protein